MSTKYLHITHRGAVQLIAEGPLGGLYWLSIPLLPFIWFRVVLSGLLYPATVAPELPVEFRDNLQELKIGAKRLSKTLNPENWLDAYGDALYRYALSRVRDSSVAEDLLQETFLAAIKSQHSFLGNSTELTWLTGILRHKTLDFFRKSSRTKEQSLDPISAEGAGSPFNAEGAWNSPPSEWSSPEKSLEKDEFWLKMQACVAALPETMRQSYVLREFDALESEEIAEVLNITTNNLWVMLSRARLKLRQCLQNHWFAESN